MSPLERAIEIASEAHAGQTDKCGAPYIEHPLRVSSALPEGDAQIAGVLHDVVEDSAWTLEQLADEGFSEEVLAAVDACTRREGEGYGDFVARAGRDPLGRLVKVVDLRDNLDVTRLGEITDRDRLRILKYTEALALLALGH
jgi:hypothetical protein